MKLISPEEIRRVLEALTTAQEELEAAVYDGWVTTTGVESDIIEAKSILQAIHRSKSVEVRND